LLPTTCLVWRWKIVHDCYIYMITYEGQWDGRKMEGESPYTYTASSRWWAEHYKKELEQEFPGRVWTIEEKDVS
jgi:hypothetical protein